MSAFLTALGNIGSQYGEAKDEARKEKLAQGQQELAQGQQERRLSAEEAYLQLAKDREAREAQKQKADLERGDLVKIGNRLWSVSKAKFIDTGTPDPMNTLREFVKSLPPDQQKGAASRAQMELEADPGNPKAAIDAVLYYANMQQAEAQRREDKATAAQERREDKATATKESERYRTEARKDTQDFQREMRQEHEDFVKSLSDAKKQGLTPAAEKVLYSTEPVVQQVDRLLGDIDRLKLGANNQSGYLLVPRLKYGVGQASPKGTLASDIAGLSLGSVIEAASAIQGTSRSLQALKLAAVHTPNAWKDSPMLIKQKLTEIRKRLADIMADARKYGTKSGMFNEPDIQQGPTGPVDIDKVLDSIPSLSGKPQ